MFELISPFIWLPFVKKKKKSNDSENITILGCTEFNGQQVRSTVILNPVERSAVVLEDKDDSELKGPVVRQHTMED